MAFCVAACLAAFLPLLVLSDSRSDLADIDICDDHCALSNSTELSTDHACGMDVGTLVLMKDFDVDKYTGSWHEVYTTGDPNRCSTHVFSTASSTVTYFEKDFNPGTASYTSRQGAAKVIANAQLMIRRPMMQSLENYWVVDTDYDTYSVVYSCPTGTASPDVVAVRVLSRDYVLASRVAGRVYDVLLERFNLTRANLSAADNEGCIPDVCPPVGPTLQYLDPTRFAGKWHQLLVKYREAPQNALQHCAKWLATPTPNASLFLQREAQGPDESPARLPTLEARPVDSLAGDGRYVIQQRLADGVVAVVQFDILDSDYNTWALVSVCNRTVMRSSLDNAVDRYTILLTRYPLVDSVPWNQVEDAEALHDLKGLNETTTTSLSCPARRCGDGVPVKRPFDMGKFLGYWYIMEETPTKSTTGFCAKHVLKAENRSNSVRLDIIQHSGNPHSPTITSTYELSWGDPTESKLNVTDLAPDDGDPIESYWVLDTDYYDFAVTYSCSGPRTERVWVLSRAHTLSWTAARRITDVMVQCGVDVTFLAGVDWPPFCASSPNPDDGPDQPPYNRAPRTAHPAAAAVTVTMLVAACRAAAAFNQPRFRVRNL